MSKFLKLHNISKTFETSKKLKVIKNLSYTFNKGKIYSLMGPSGSGKSTLLNLISLIDNPSTGSIRFNNHEINHAEKEENDKFRAKKIGIVYQQNNLLPDFTSLENIYFLATPVPAHGHEARFDQAGKAASQTAPCQYQSAVFSHRERYCCENWRNANRSLKIIQQL